MGPEIRTVNFGVNSYLVKTATGFVLIDTGISSKRAALVAELAHVGCAPGDLKLVLLTHGDIDHSGNAAFLRDHYGAKIAMHRDDVGMVERGDMKWNRKSKPDRFSLFFRIVSRLIKQPPFETFQPDLMIDETFDLCAYGFDARVLYLPGHSKGSIGILTASGDLFCGDLIYNMGGPGRIVYVDDAADHAASMAKIKNAHVITIYPGHGKPFAMKDIPGD